MSIYYNLFARKLGLAKTTVWGTAIRNKSNCSTVLNNDNTVPFRVIPNTSEYWFADPLLFEDMGKVLLFVEAYSYERHKGELGVFDIIDGEAKC